MNCPIDNCTYVYPAEKPNIASIVFNHLKSSHGMTPGAELEKVKKEIVDAYNTPTTVTNVQPERVVNAGSVFADLNILSEEDRLSVISLVLNGMGYLPPKKKGEKPEKKNPKHKNSPGGRKPQKKTPKSQFKFEDTQEQQSPPVVVVENPENDWALM